MPLAQTRPVLCVRIHAGFNAQRFLAGLLELAGQRFMTPAELLAAKFPGCQAGLELKPVAVNSIAGVAAVFDAAPERCHRGPADIAAIYARSRLSAPARAVAGAVWDELARAEARVHNAAPEAVHFHEVGRMANVLAIGLIGELVAAIGPSAVVASPLPVGDGAIRCAHGVIPSPAPAMLAMLDGVSVRPFAGEGEPVTPTGLAVLKGLGARFGAWPAMRVRRHATAFVPGKAFAGVPNGAIFVLGDPA